MSYKLKYSGAEIDDAIDKVQCLFPIGYIYMSVDSTNPSTFFGGTWERIENTFLLAAGSSYNAGSTGGSASSAHTHSVTCGGSVAGHALTIDEMPSHNHSYWMLGDAAIHDNWCASRASNLPSGNGSTNYTGGGWEHSHGFTGSTVTSGGASNTNNMPPYLAVYMWKRTA